MHEWITLGKNLASRGNVSYLPLPYAARQVKVGGGGDWRVDGNTLSVLSPSARLAGLHYQVIAKDVNPLPQQLRPTARARWHHPAGISTSRPSTGRRRS